MAVKKKSEFEGIVTKLGLQPMESPTMVAARRAKLFIGIPTSKWQMLCFMSFHRDIFTKFTVMNINGPLRCRVLSSNGIAVFLYR